MCDEFFGFPQVNNFDECLPLLFSRKLEVSIWSLASWGWRKGCTTQKSSRKKASQRKNWLYLCAPVITSLEKVDCHWGMLFKIPPKGTYDREHTEKKWFRKTIYLGHKTEICLETCWLLWREVTRSSFAPFCWQLDKHGWKAILVYMIFWRGLLVVCHLWYAHLRTVDMDRLSIVYVFTSHYVDVYREYIWVYNAIHIFQKELQYLKHPTGWESSTFLWDYHAISCLLSMPRNGVANIALMVVRGKATSSIIIWKTLVDTSDVVKPAHYTLYVQFSLSDQLTILTRKQMGWNRSYLYTCTCFFWHWNDRKCFRMLAPKIINLNLSTSMFGPPHQSSVAVTYR